MPTKENGHIVETAVEARAGFLDRPVAVVLMVSTVCVVIGFAAIYLGFFNTRGPAAFPRMQEAGSCPSTRVTLVPHGR